IRGRGTATKPSLDLPWPTPIRRNGTTRPCSRRQRREPGPEESLMVPVEATAFGLLAVCVIVLALLLFFTLLFPRDSAMLARSLLVPALVVVVVLAIYVLITPRVR